MLGAIVQSFINNLMSHPVSTAAHVITARPTAIGDVQGHMQNATTGAVGGVGHKFLGTGYGNGNGEVLSGAIAHTMGGVIQGFLMSGRIF